ncbi:PP2C family protein-serine/threonine phosphatase, partial [Klebsiella aerogenes]|uniref:PP2C family protein-serine/threonine phosphatase n=1 Tax=Klebsiella aerogenes TaxID=548 RepID=UPI0034DB0100|nr:hypothetical protein [Klebsiella aerogenes]
GMGGHPNGDLASQEAIKILSESFDDTKLTEIDLRNLISKIESTISGYKDHRGTTLIVAFVQDHQIIVIHIGDSYL